MLIHPAAVVALVLYLIVGPLTVSQQIQTRFKSLSHGVHQKISSVLSLPRAAFGSQDYPIVLEATIVEALPIVPVETSIIHPVEVIPTSPAPLEDYVETVVQEVYPTRYDGHPSSASVPVFVVSSECRGPFDWRDLFNYQVLEVLAAIYFSIWFRLVVIPFVAKLFSRSESRDEVERPIDASPELLPPKFLPPPMTVQIQISNPKPPAPLEPIFSLPPPEPSTFWLVCECPRTFSRPLRDLIVLLAEQRQQDQPSPASPPLLRLLDLPPLENESRNKRKSLCASHSYQSNDLLVSPLSSPADSGYGSTLHDTASGASSLGTHIFLPRSRALPLIFTHSVSGDSVTTTPEHSTALLPTAGAESILVHGRFSLSLRFSICLTRLSGLKSVTTTSDNFSGEKIDTAGFVRLPRFALVLPLTSAFQDTELEDDDDGSTTVTNSTANLTDLIIRPTSVSAEVLAAKLECITAALIEGAKSLPEPPAEEPPVAIPSLEDSTADLPSHDEPSMDLPFDYETTAEFGATTQEPAVGVSVNTHTPSEPPSDAIADPICIERGVTGTSLEEGETQIEAHPPSQDDLEQDAEPWIPDYEIPSIVVSPPSEADPEDPAQEFDSEGEQEESESVASSDLEDEPEPKSEHEESEYGESELEYADDCFDNPVAEVGLDSPPSPVEARGDPCRSPCRSPITKSGMLWSDNEDEDLGPLPFGGISHEEVYDSLESPAPVISDATEITGHSEVIGAVKQTEAKFSPVEEETWGTVNAASDDSNGMCSAYLPPPKNGLMKLFSAEEPIPGVAQQPTEGPQPTPEAPAQNVVEPIPSTGPSPSPKNSPHTSRPKRARTQASSDNGHRGEGSNRNGKTLDGLPYFHCCDLYKSKLWENWKIEKRVDCIPKVTSLQEWQFVRPTDKDGENPTTRIAIDNLDAKWFRTVDGVLSYNYLTEAMGFFSTKSYRCWRGRIINGVEYSSVGYATVDLDSVGEAIRMFGELQGRRLRGHTWHWRLKFVDPSDETHGGRRVVRTELVPDLVKQALAAELEASTRRRGTPGHSGATSNGTADITRLPAKVRPQLSIASRSLITSAMTNVVQDRRTGERAAQSTRAPSRRSYRS